MFYHIPTLTIAMRILIFLLYLYYFFIIFLLPIGPVSLLNIYTSILTTKYLGAMSILLKSFPLSNMKILLKKI